MSIEYANINLRKQILSLAWPAILEMVLHTAVWIFDTAMVGRLNAEALSAVGFASQLASTLTFVFSAIGIGTSAVVARNIGEENQKKAEHVVAQAFLVSLIIGISIALINFIYGGAIFLMFMDDPVVIALGTDYIKIVSIGIIFTVPTLVMNSALRGAGNTKLPMFSAFIANTINIVGDYVLIFGKLGFPSLGVNGAAIATTVSQIFGAIITIGYMVGSSSEVRLKLKGLLDIDITIIKQIVNISIPACLEELSHSGSKLLTSMWLVRLGTVPFAAHQVAVSAESMSFMPGYGFSVAASSLVGRNLGAGKERLAEISGWKSTKYSAILMSLVGVFFFMFPNWIISFFTNITDVQELAVKCIIISAFEQPAIAVLTTLAGALRGAGDTKGPFYIRAAVIWLIRMPLIFTVVFILKKNVTSVWLVIVIQFYIEAILMTIRYKKGQWKEIELN